MPAINHVAVLTTIVVSQLLGFLWYSVLFGKPWALGYRLQENALADMAPWTYLITIAGAALFGYGTAIFAGLIAVSGLSGGLLLGAGLWLGILAPRYLLHAVFGRISVPAMAIDMGFDALISVSTAIILTLWLPG